MGKKKIKKNNSFTYFLLTNTLILTTLFFFTSLLNNDISMLISSRALFHITTLLIVSLVFLKYRASKNKNKYKKIAKIIFIFPVLLQLIGVNILRISLPAPWYQVINLLFFASALFLGLVYLSNMKKSKININRWEVIFLLVMSGLFIYFGTQHLGQFMSVDEPKWVHNRVPQLYEAIRTRNWEDTYINDKPGVLPSYLAGITNFFMDKSEYQSDPLNYETYLFFWRLPILLFNALLLIPTYFFSRKLLDRRYAIAITSLIALNPVLVGISQIVNPDSTLWAPTFLSFMTFFLYLKGRDDMYLILSGIFLGLALTSKFAAAVLYPTFLIIVLLDYLVMKRSKEEFIKTIVRVLLLFGISSLVYGILVPASWVHYRLMWGRTIGISHARLGTNIITLIIGLVMIEMTLIRERISRFVKENIDVCKIGILTLGILNVLILGILVSDQLSDGALTNLAFFDYLSNNYDFYIYSRASFRAMMIISSIPLLLGFFFIVFTIFREDPKYKENRMIILSFLFFTYFFIIGSSLGGFTVGARYQIMLFPTNSVLASFFFISIIKNVKVSIFTLVLLSFIGILNSKPFYYHHNNILRHIGIQRTNLWGYGGYELAQIMNELPNAEELTVWVDREGFREFFVGTSYFRRTDLYDTDEYEVDYLILTDGGERILNNRVRSHYTPGEEITHKYAKLGVEENLLDLYKKEPKFIFCINGEKGIEERTHERCVWAIEFDREYVHEE